jgi:hypothetical protein
MVLIRAVILSYCRVWEKARVSSRLRATSKAVSRGAKALSPVRCADRSATKPPWIRQPKQSSSVVTNNKLVEPPAPISIGAVSSIPKSTSAEAAWQAARITTATKSVHLTGHPLAFGLRECLHLQTPRWVKRRPHGFVPNGPPPHQSLTQQLHGEPDRRFPVQLRWKCLWLMPHYSIMSRKSGNTIRRGTFGHCTCPMSSPHTNKRRMPGPG